MPKTNKPGNSVILNGTPRSGKSSIATIVQNTFNGVWINLGVDTFMKTTPQRDQPGIGLRPGGERPDLEPLIVTLYHAMYESIAAHSRLGVNVVVDVRHHIIRDTFVVGVCSICSECHYTPEVYIHWISSITTPSNFSLKSFNNNQKREMKI